MNSVGEPVIRSMTGFGAGQVERDGLLVRAEVRSVNHRFFDTSIRISREFGGLEGRVREVLASRIARGRVSTVVEIQPGADAGRLSLDERLAGEYAEIVRALGAKYGISGAADPVAFAQLPEVVQSRLPEFSLETVRSVVEEALGGALDQLTAMRADEGAALEKDLAMRVRRLESVLDRIEEEAAGNAVLVRQRLEEKIGALVPEGTEPDPERLATEVALLADKADVVEEVVRFRSHDRAFLEFLEKDEPVGKRLDFLLQEMNREINTIGSKAIRVEVTHLVVEAKEEIERLREQVQNIE